jgi:hypothetical protein
MREVAIPFDGDDCLTWPYRTNRQGYAQLTRGANVCRVVCEAVNGPPPTSAHEAAHTCGRGAYGCVNGRHLRWKTRAENEADKVLHGTSNRGERGAAAKITREDVLEIRRLRGVLLQREIAERYGITESTVGQIQRRSTWGWLNDDGTEQLPSLAHGKPKSNVVPMRRAS